MYAEGDAMEASVNGDDNGTVKIRLSLPRCDLETLINAEKQRFKELVFVRVRLAYIMKTSVHEGSRQPS